jgi:hypothetical protein
MKMKLRAVVLIRVMSIRTLCLSALVCLMTCSLHAQKAYDRVDVVVTGAQVNDKKVVGIDAQSFGRTVFFTLNCNEDVASCTLPAVGKVYTLFGIAHGFYKCDNYLLNDIPVCLVSAQLIQ